MDNQTKFFGSTDTKKKIISINVKKSKATGQPGELLDSLHHEILHARFPHRSEKRVRDMSDKSRLSQKTKQKLYSLIK